VDDGQEVAESRDPLDGSDDLDGTYKGSGVCGCSSTGPAPWLAVALLAAVVTRRRFSAAG